MFNRDKSVISYIAKDGREGSLDVNVFNKKRANELLEKQGNCYSVSSNLSFVHFKNIIFDESLYFHAKDVVVIFEDCIFNGENLTIHGGSVEIINPIVTSRKYIFNSFKYSSDGLKKIKVCDADDFRVVISDDKNDRVIDYNIDANNIEIDGGKAYFDLIKGESVCLKNLEVFKQISFWNIDNLFLSNLSFNDRFYSLVLNVRKKLYLSNINTFSIINCFRRINIECPCIEIGGNVLLATNDIIRVNDDIYHALYGEYLILRDSDLLENSKVNARKSLISLLKGYRNLVEQCTLSKEKEDEVLVFYDTLINKGKNDIKELEDKLETLECNKQKYSENLKKKLFRSKAIDYVKK